MPKKLNLKQLSINRPKNMDIILETETRLKKEKLASDLVPAVIYGHGIASSSLKVKRGDIDKVTHQAGESNLITLKQDGKTKKVLIKEIQRDGLTGKILHVDFFEVNMTDKITTEIPLHFVGESKAIKEKAGLLIKDIDFLEIECLPNNLVDHIDVDISVLKEYHDEITIKDLILPKGIELTSETNRVVASILPPKVVVEETPAPAATSTEANKPASKEEIKSEKK